MDSSSVPVRGRSRVVPKELDNNNNHLRPGRVLKPHPSGRSTPSFSSSSLSSSYSLMLPEEASRPSAPPTPLRFSGVPFSWEKTPGIPKKQSSCRRKDKDKDSAATLLGRSFLPLPPSATPPTSRRFTGADEVSLRKKVLFPGGTRYQWDPFVAALVECSKEEGYGNNGNSNGDRDHNGSNLWIGRRVSRSISDRFGFIALYGSCKRASPISESIIYLPRSSPSPYFVMNGRSH